MDSITNESWVNQFLLASVGSAVVGLSAVDTFTDAGTNNLTNATIDDSLTEHMYSPSTDYLLFSSNHQNLNLVLGFAQNFVENTVDMDEEFQKVIEDNFWDMI